MKLKSVLDNIFGISGIDELCTNKMLKINSVDNSIDFYDNKNQKFITKFSYRNFKKVFMPTVYVVTGALVYSLYWIFNSDHYYIAAGLASYGFYAVVANSIKKNIVIPTINDILKSVILLLISFGTWNYILFNNAFEQKELAANAYLYLNGIILAISFIRTFLSFDKTIEALKTEKEID